MEQTQPLDFSKKPPRKISQEKVLQLQNLVKTSSNSIPVASVSSSLNLKKSNYYDDDIKEFSSPSDSDD